MLREDTKALLDYAIVEYQKNGGQITTEQINELYARYSNDNRPYIEIEMEVLTSLKEKINYLKENKPISSEDRIAKQEKFMAASTFEIIIDNPNKAEATISPLTILGREVAGQGITGTQCVTARLDNGIIIKGFMKSSTPAHLDEQEVMVSEIGQLLDVPVAKVHYVYADGQKGVISLNVVPPNHQMVLANDPLFQTLPLVLSEEELQVTNHNNPLSDAEQVKVIIDLALRRIASLPNMTPENMETIKHQLLNGLLFDYLTNQSDRIGANIGILLDENNVPYQLAPLFDNGALHKKGIIEADEMHLFSDRFCVKREALLECLFMHYHEYIGAFSEYLYTNQDQLAPIMTSIVRKNHRFADSMEKTIVDNLQHISNQVIAKQTQFTRI